MVTNPAEHASLPQGQRRLSRNRPQPWTVDELTAWLRLALLDRFAALWLLAATSGMRRSELAGADRELLDLNAGTLRIEDTRVVVAGQAIDSDGKSNSGVRTISLDPFTVDLVRRYLAVLDDERAAFGAGYDTSHSSLMRFEDGRRLHADTVTRRFNRLVDLAGVRRIRLHDVRHTYATLALDSGVHAKIVSDRIGHAHEGITVQIYGHRSTGHDREAAEAFWTHAQGPSGLACACRCELTVTEFAPSGGMRDARLDARGNICNCSGDCLTDLPPAWRGSSVD